MSNCRLKGVTYRGIPSQVRLTLAERAEAARRAREGKDAKAAAAKS